MQNRQKPGYPQRPFFGALQTRPQPYWRGPSLGLGGCLLLALAVPPIAFGAPSFWVPDDPGCASSTPYFDESTCWQPGVPGADDEAVFNNAGSYEVIWDNVVLGNWQTATGSALGVVTNNALRVQNGTVRISPNDSTPFDYAISGRVDITTNGTLNLGNVGQPMRLTVGGVTTVDTGGTAAVAGEGSALASSANLIVGNSGAGTLDIRSGGMVSNAFGVLGQNAGSTGTATVDGSGSTWTNSGDVYVGGSDGAAGGSGSLIVQNDGAVTVTNTLKVWETGSVNLDGGSITTGSFDAAPGTFTFEDGTLSIVGGTYNDGNTQLTIDSIAPGANPELILNSGTAAVTGNAIIGESGTGFLDILDGGTLTNANSFVGRNTGGSGGVTLADNGSTWTNSAALTVGNSGSGTLDIRSGAAVSNTTGFVGRNADGIGDVTVAGNGSTWTNSESLRLGASGTGSLSISEGGTVYNTTDAMVGFNAGSTGAATVADFGSTWSNSASLRLGESGTGTLDIFSGGTVSNTTGYLGRKVGGIGTATVDGNGSTWSNSNNLRVGGNDSVAGGSGSLTVQNDGVVTVTNTLKVWETGSVNLDGGRITAGSFDAAPGTFTFLDGTLSIVGGTYSDGNTHLTIDGTAPGAYPRLELLSGSAAVTGNAIIGESGRGDLLIVNDGGTLSSNNGFVGRNAGASGTATIVGPGASWTNSGDLTVGDSGIADIGIFLSGAVSNTTGFVGRNAGSFGQVTVDGPGTTWANSASLRLGASGEGILSITNGGTVSNTYSIVGFNAGSNGTATVAGTGSTWSNSEVLRLGESGTGTLDIQSGGTVSNTTGYLGRKVGGSGTATVDGNGSTWSNSNNLRVGGNDTVAGGSGSLTVQNDGAVTVANTLKVWETGSVNLDGGRITTGSFDAAAGTFMFNDGSLVINDGTYSDGNTNLVIDSTVQVANPTLVLIGDGSADVAGNAIIGDSGRGALDILNGGTLSNTAGFLGRNHGSSGSAYVAGTGASWTNSSGLTVGDSGSGFLLILDGGTVSNTAGYVGRNDGSTGTAFVEGTGAAWTNSSNLFVGLDGSGTLTISDGGAVSNTNGYVGRNVGSTGGATVDGPGSSWVNSAALLVGESGVGTLDIINGGAVSNTNGFLGRNVGSTGGATVDGPGSSWVNSAALLVGESGVGTLDIINGGAVSNTNGFLGRYAGSTGTVTVDGPGSTWTNSNNLRVGGDNTAAGGSGSLTVQNDGAVTVTNTLQVWETGSVNLDGGSITTGSFDAAPVTFTFDDGTLTVNGGTYSDGNTDLTVDGTATGANPTLVLNGGSAAGVRFALIGESGNGTLDIQSGGTLSNTVGFLGLNAGSTGTATVDGSGSIWTNSSSLTVGSSGSGTLDIQSGGRVSNTDGFLGLDAGATGTATVAGTWASSGDLFVGVGGTGTLDIQSGGTVSNTVGVLGGGSGIGTATVAGTWTNSSELLVGAGATGTGTLDILSGGTVANLYGYLGFISGSTGTATVDGPGSAWINNANLVVGASGTGTLDIQSGGTVFSGRGQVGVRSGSTGTVTVDGPGSTWTNSYLHVGDSLGGTGLLNVNSGGTVNVADGFYVSQTGTVNLNGGTLNVASLLGVDAHAGFNFNAGALNIGNDLLLDSTGPLGNAVSLPGFKSLGVAGTTTLSGFNTLSVDGGVFSTGSLVNNGGFAFNSGTFNLTGDDLTIGTGGLFGSVLQASADQSINVTNTTTVAANGLLYLNGGAFSSGNLVNNGHVALDGLLSNLGGAISNNSLLSGNGRISTVLTNNVGGEVQVSSGDTLRFSAAGNSNTGQINLAGGTVRFDEDLHNNAGGVIAGRGTLYANGGLTNQGAVNLSSGITSLHGDVNNTAGGAIIISGNGTATFFDDMVHNGSEIRVSDGSTAVFFGEVSGAGDYTGEGSVFFEGGLNPGNSPGLITLEGDMILGENSYTFMELGGLQRGTHYDAFDIDGTLALNGILELDLYDLGFGEYNPLLGDTFDLFRADTINGLFDEFIALPLGGQLAWNLSFLADEFGDTDVLRLSVVSPSAVPLPAAFWLFASALLGLGAIKRRARAAH